MTTNVYQVWGRDCSVPLSIFAPSTDEAALTFLEWVKIHRPFWTEHPVRIEEVDDEWLAERPQLTEAVERAKATGVHDAVLLFINHKAGWVAVPTHATEIGAIAAPEPAVSCFDVTVDKEHLEGSEVLVFARDAAHALELYRQWHETFYGELSHRYEIREFSRWTMTGDQAVLRDQMDMGCSGIAGWSPVRGWSIYPPDHEMAGE